ncbi:hypothetical protein P7K49_023489 [Saguinus oedipus]|uniref:Uncharacterized protein n=1 Tax=Saguinus oedipus TaxID=9490 RepID=A0ABQ9ULW8_SAGOE|nr:hypothetical protein P7K49_023489 [Saguinus oedipus]
MLLGQIEETVTHVKLEKGFDVSSTSLLFWQKHKLLEVQLLATDKEAGHLPPQKRVSLGAQQLLPWGVFQLIPPGSWQELHHQGCKSTS